MTMDMRPKDAGEEYWIKRQDTTREDLLRRNRERLQMLDAEAAAGKPEKPAPQGGKGQPVKMERNPLYAPPSVGVEEGSVAGRVARDVG